VITWSWTRASIKESNAPRLFKDCCVSGVTNVVLATDGASSYLISGKIAKSGSANNVYDVRVLEKFESNFDKPEFVQRLMQGPQSREL
jgi:hypothetical protein